MTIANSADLPPISPEFKANVGSSLERSDGRSTKDHPPKPIFVTGIALAEDG